MEPKTYCHLNITMPVLRLYLDGETDLRPDYRLNRGSLEHLMAITRSRQDHGWGHHMEVLVFIFWLASATSYRVVSRSSPLYTRQLYPPQGFYLLGDGGYPCLSAPVAIITPYKEPVRLETSRRFNHHHAKARSIIERSFGSLKTRWRSIFLKALEVKVTFAPDVIACCTILHNICLSNGDIMEPAEEVRPDDNATMPHHHQEQQNGYRIRENLTAAVSAPDALVAALEGHDYT